MEKKPPIKLHEEAPNEFKFSNDRSFIIKLDQIVDEYKNALAASDPSVDNPVIDGYKQGKYDAAREIREAYKHYG